MNHLSIVFLTGEIEAWKNELAVEKANSLDDILVMALLPSESFLFSPLRSPADLARQPAPELNRATAKPLQ